MRNVKQRDSMSVSSKVYQMFTDEKRREHEKHLAELEHEEKVRCLEHRERRKKERVRVRNNGCEYEKG